MLNRRGLFRFLAAAPVVAPMVAKELAQPLHAGGFIEPGMIAPRLFGELDLVTITSRSQAERLAAFYGGRRNYSVVIDTDGYVRDFLPIDQPDFDGTGCA
ncbi:hypothetical protein [Hyphomicrobium sp. DY-1]|uniref:hypothetical protein n=1 Tax=Hyphomicrobium sp. DY-1 TaxID=3075650 RepID=UPI0039C4773A